MEVLEVQYRLEDWEWSSALPLFERCLSTMQQLVQEVLGKEEEAQRRVVIVAWALDGLYAKLLYILAHLDYPEARSILPLSHTLSLATLLSLSLPPTPSPFPH